LIKVLPLLEKPIIILGCRSPDKQAGRKCFSQRSNFAFYHKNSIMIVLLGRYLRQIVICWVHISENDAVPVFLSRLARFNIRHSSLANFLYGAIFKGALGNILLTHYKSNEK